MRLRASTFKRLTSLRCAPASRAIRFCCCTSYSACNVRQKDGQKRRRRVNNATRIGGRSVTATARAKRLASSSCRTVSNVILHCAHFAADGAAIGSRETRRTQKKGRFPSMSSLCEKLQRERKTETTPEIYALVRVEPTSSNRRNNHERMP